MPGRRAGCFGGAVLGIRWLVGGTWSFGREGAATLGVQGDLVALEGFLGTQRVGLGWRA